MRTKTFVDLLLLSSNLYMIAKDTDAIEKIKEYSEQGKDKVNDFMKEKVTDSEGNELEFVDKMVVKIGEAKQEIEEKIEKVVIKMYDKMNIAHSDQIESLENKINSLTKDLSLANERIQGLEGK